MSSKMPYIILLFLLLLIKCNNKKVEKYSNGNTKIIYSLNGGKKDGNYKEYYKNGNIKIKGEYDNGMKNGKFIYYDKEGEKDDILIFKNDTIKKAISYYEKNKINQKRFYENNSLKKTIAFYKNGNIKFKKIYNHNGDVVYFREFNKEGNQKKGQNNIGLLFIPDLDTLEKGKEYKFKIKAANPFYNEKFMVDTNVSINKGNISDDEIKKIITSNLEHKLANINDTVATLKLKADKLGVHEITGLAFDMDTSEKFKLVTIPLRKEFYVKNPTK